MEKTMWFLGVDPGATGSLGLVAQSGYLAQVEDMPDTERGILELFQSIAGKFDIVHAAIEEVGAFPGQGVSSTFRFGYNTGLARMALISIGVPWEVVRPTTWVKALGLSNSGRGEKERNSRQRARKHAYREMAERLFPATKFKAGNADSVLIAEYMRRRHCGIDLVRGSMLGPA